MALFHIKGTPITGVAITIALLSSIGGLVFGYDTGQISDILLMDDFKLRFATCMDSTDPASCKFAHARTGAIVGFFAVGTMIGSLGGGSLAESLGRRRSMWIACLVYSLGVAVQISSRSAWAQYAAGRLIGGLGVGSLSVVVPMYQAETSPAVIRGTLTATYQLFITLGILIAYCVSTGTRSMETSGSWRTVIGIAFLWPILLSLGMIFMPESPRWLTREGHLNEARTALARVYGVRSEDAEMDSHISKEIDEAHRQAISERNLSATWLDCFRPANKTLYRTVLGICLQSLQQLTGANYFFYFGATIFQSVGISDSLVTQIILGGVNFVATIGGLYIMQKFGRRWPLIIGGLWMSIWLFVFASVGVSHDVENDKAAGTLMIVSACLFIVGFATTWAPGVWIIISESFAPRTRAKQCSLATASMWIWNFMISFFTPFITADIGYAYGFIFAGCNLFAAVFVYMFLYESSDLTLEVVDQMYNDPKCKAWTSAQWSTSGGHSAHDPASATPSFGSPEEKIGSDHSSPDVLPYDSTSANMR